MSDRLIGQLIREVREERGILRKNLCKGICGIDTLRNVERQRQDLDLLELECLWQRLGQSMNQFTIILDEPEYKIWKKRQDIPEKVSEVYEAYVTLEKKKKQREEKLEQRKKRQAEENDRYNEKSMKILEWEYKEKLEAAWKCIREYETKYGNRSVLHKQVAGYYRIILREQEGASYEELYRECIDTITLTISEYDSAGRLNWQRSYLGEIELLILVQLYRFLEEMGREEEALSGYWAVLRYVEEHNYEVEAEMVYCPVLAYRLNALLIKGGRYQEAWQVAKNAIGVLRKSRSGTRLLPELFLQFTECEKQITKKYTEQSRLYELCGRVLERYLDTLDQIRRYTDLRPYYSRCELYSFQKVFASRKEYFGSSQEMLAMEIDPATISLLGQAKRRPQQGSYKTILRNIGLSGVCYSSYYVLGGMEARTLFQNVNRAINKSNPKEARIILEEFKKKIDPTIVMNQQTIGSLEAVIERLEGKLTEKELIKKYEKLLKLTLREYKPENIKGVYLSAGERGLIVDMALEYKKLGNVEKACEIMRSLQGEVAWTSKRIDIAGWMGDWLGELGEYEEGICIVSKARKIAAKAKDNWHTGDLLIAEGWNTEQFYRGRKSVKAIWMYYVAYLFCVLFDNAYSKAAIKNYCKVNYPFLAKRIEKIEL
ncbi:MAG: hypothetical protein J6B85_09005 [Lachnospiraceae bacterium]|nr:hypothetical protein [Lachnospiraceae bacterium]